MTPAQRAWIDRMIAAGCCTQCGLPAVVKVIDGEQTTQTRCAVCRGKANDRYRLKHPAGKQICSKCGDSGHNVRTCTEMERR